MKPLQTLSNLLLITLLAGCTSSSDLRPDVTSVSVEQAKKHPAQYKGAKIFWGGTILSVKNFKDYSRIEVLKRPLSGSEPNDLKSSEGRFMTRVTGFVDPAEYKTPSRISVYGTLQGVAKGKVGEYPYLYPSVSADEIKFWRGKKAKPQPIQDPYWWGHHYYPFHHSYRSHHRGHSGHR